LEEFMPTDTIPALFLSQGRQRPTAPAYHVRRGDGWATTSWSSYCEQVRSAARALLALGVPAGGRICVLGFNRPEWVTVDVAAMAVGAVPTGIYTTCSSEEVVYIVRHSEASVVVLEDASQWDKIAGERDNLPQLEHVVMMDGAEAIDDERVMSWPTFVDRANDVDASELDARLAALEPTDLGTLIYTSGTTGPPKAVMLSHHNLAWTALAAVDLFTVTNRDSMLSYLPLAHIAEQVFSIHAPAASGMQIYFAESFDKVAENLKQAQPTIVFGVPRVWEKFHAAVSGKLAEASGAKARMIAWARVVGSRNNAAKNDGQKPGVALRLQYRLANRLIFSKLKPRLGLGRARLCVSGGAAISKEILEFFTGLDVVIREVYGQSEDTGPTSFNRFGRTRYGTVGPVFPGLEVRIAEDGEILVRGPSVFTGYLKDPDATADVLDADGWLHSGDLGALDDEGFLRITGRKKEIIITAGGKNIAPKNIEDALKELPLVSQAVVIGEQRRYLAALLTLDPEATASFATGRGIDEAGVIGSEALQVELQAGVDEVNSHFGQVEHIRRFAVLPEEFSIEGGELTPTMKIKRRVINDKYAAQLEALYD
jgi:long-chain acyl-CoA synthetase